MKEQVMPIDLLIQIISKRIDIKDDHVLLYDEKFTIPPDDNGLFIFVQYDFGMPYANRINHCVDASGNYIEVQNINVREEYTIGLYSRDESSLRMKEKVQMALRSNYAQQVQEENSFSIFSISKPIEGLSELEGAAQLRRFDIGVTVHASYEERKIIQYFDTLNVEVDANSSAPVIPDMIEYFTQSTTQP